MITKSRHVLRFGDLDWKGAVSPAGWRMQALAEGADFGNPVAVDRDLAHQLLDGSVSERVGYDNRTATFDVFVCADDSTGLALGAAALDMACDNPSTLVWSPPDGLGATTVFEVVTAKADWIFDDLDELNKRRRFRVTIECQPFGKSVDPVTDAVEPVENPAGDEQVNACDATTGFAGSGGASVEVDSEVYFEGTGSIKLTDLPLETVVIPEGRRAMYSGAVELTGLSLTAPEERPFISFKGYSANARDHAATLHVNGVEAEFVQADRVDASWMQFWFRTQVTDTITDLRIDQTMVNSLPWNWQYVDGVWIPLGLPESWRLRVDDIRRDGSPTSMARQSLRLAPVRGSARTQGSVAVEHDTDGLGWVFLLSTPLLSTGFQPNLMKWCTGTTSADADSVSGRVADWGQSNPVTFEFPASMLTAGSYQMVGVMDTAGGGMPTFTATAKTKLGSTVLSTGKPHSQRIDGTGAGVFKFVDCGPITLPTTNVPAGSAATVELTVELPSATGAELREMFLVPLVSGTAWNVFDCGANRRLWLDSADSGSRRASAWLGSAEDRSDAFHAAGAALRWMPLSLRPPGTLLFLANSGGEYATVTLTHTPAWHGLAAE